MFKEYDIVYSTEDITKKIPTNTRGVIVMILNETNGIYEVEFVDDNNTTLGVIEVTANQIRNN
ncbi:DUF4926 domain-containing protein [Enterococcus sp. AZ126]|uniref:DUF4926 domain-containing protein n=1 Tax=Enterococcus sp. AZ126 TaxID=2774635 RepID=UPI003F1F678D